MMRVEIHLVPAEGESFYIKKDAKIGKFGRYWSLFLIVSMKVHFQLIVLNNSCVFNM